VKGWGRESARKRAIARLNQIDSGVVIQLNHEKRLCVSNSL
jgi:hypothetical protein